MTDASYKPGAGVSNVILVTNSSFPFSFIYCSFLLAPTICYLCNTFWCSECNFHSRYLRESWSPISVWVVGGHTYVISIIAPWVRQVRVWKNVLHTCHTAWQWSKGDGILTIWDIRVPFIVLVWARWSVHSTSPFLSSLSHLPCILLSEGKNLVIHMCNGTATWNVNALASAPPPQYTKINK